MIGDIVGCRADSSTANHPIVFLGESLGSFDDDFFVIRDDLDAFDVNTEVKAEFGKVVAVGIFGFAVENFVSNDQASCCRDVAVGCTERVGFGEVGRGDFSNVGSSGAELRAEDDIGRR